MSPWIRTDDDLHDDPRVVVVSLAAYGLLHVALGWASRHLTDGWVSVAVVRQRAGSAAKAHIAQLSSTGLWRPADRTGQPGFQIADDIMAWQLTTEQVKERRRQRAASGRTGGQRSAVARAAKHISRKAEANAQASASLGAEANAKQISTPVPVPVPVPEGKSTGARAPAPIATEATHNLLCALLDQGWPRFTNTTDRLDALQACLRDRGMTATKEAIDKAERVVSFGRGQQRSNRTPGMTSVSAMVNAGGLR